MALSPIEYPYTSAALLSALRKRPGAEVLGEPGAMCFDGTGSPLDPRPEKAGHAPSTGKT